MADLLDSEIGTRLVARAFEIGSLLVGLRRSIHQSPELGFEETKTAEAICRVISENSAGVSLSTVARTGVLATVGSDPNVLLRASIDALPMHDPKKVEYASRIAGKSHACGHDAQVAALVGATILLSEEAKDLNVACLFQPAEEIDLGARAVLESGVFNSLPVRTIIGFHGHPGLSAGEFGVNSGPVMACIATIHCCIEGQGCHGAEPHLGADPISSLAALICDWQIALARRVDSREPVVLSVCRVEGGTTSNVIPSEATLDATLRYLNPSLRPVLEEVLRDTARAIEIRFRTKIRLEIEEVVPALVNDSHVTDLVAKAVTEVSGQQSLKPVTPFLGGDDFAFLLEKAPGCYFFVGEKQPAREPYGWHDPHYDIDESSISYASAVLALAAIKASRDGEK